MLGAKGKIRAVATKPDLGQICAADDFFLVLTEASLSESNESAVGWLVASILLISSLETVVPLAVVSLTVVPLTAGLSTLSTAKRNLEFVDSPVVPSVPWTGLS